MRSRVFSASFVGLLVLAGCNNDAGGPRPTGGATSSGGQLSGGSGGVTGGAVGSGGAPSSGGTSASGGTTTSGGAPASGGTTKSGGTTGSGGTIASGGSAGRGGTTASGGTTSMGGATGSGGATAAGGSTGLGGATGPGGATGSGGRTGGGGATGSGGATSGGGATGSGGATSAAGSTGTVGPGSPGCGKTSTLTFTTVPDESGTSVGHGAGGYYTISGRSFALRLPDNYDNNKPYWLIFGFHWMGGTSAQVDTGGSNGLISAHYGLQQLSKNGAIFVAPQGNGGGWGDSGDMAFVDNMVKLIEDNYCVDTTRLYANGFSYGGGMSYAIACGRAKVFRAVAIYEGAVLSGCSGGTDPIAYWQMAGTTDTTCSIGGATPMRDKFVKNNGCTGPTTEPPRPSSISDPHICTDYTGCKAGYPLRWCVHPAGHGNAIVDGTSDLYNSCATPPKTCSDTCKCTWVPADVWKFFTSF